MKTELLKVNSGALVTASPECVAVYQDMGVPDADTGSGYYNYFVNIINNTKLSDIIKRNTCLNNVPKNVFRLPWCSCNKST